jgi:hypothetical protein
MIDKIKKVNNPLTIIAIFAALAEINATIAIGLINQNLHYIFIWFTMGFPTLLVLLFFITLNYNTKVMYSPSDFQDDENFMKSLFGDYYGQNKNLDVSKFSQELENKIIEKFQQKFNNISNDPGVTKKINEATSGAITEIKNLFSLPAELKEILLSFYQYPAYYILITALVRSRSKNIEQLKNYSNKYYIPGEWEKQGIRGLLDKKLLIGDDKNFQINDKYLESLINWVENNNHKLHSLSKAFRLKQDKDDNEEMNIKYINRINLLLSRLKF